MKYSIGYQLPDEIDSIPEICKDYEEHIAGVYFSWASENSGRLPMCTPDVAEDVERLQLKELREIKAMGKKLTLLLNANCYGEAAVSQKFKDKILFLCDFLKKNADIDSVTTTSPFVADVIKTAFGKEIEVTASVNMRIGTVQAMQQLADYFDGFYMAKECNRDFAKIDVLSDWCKANGKRLYMLANSGCMPYCGFQTFHDNLVAHQNWELEEDSSWDALPSPCHKFIRSLPNDAGLAYFLQGTWVRPEDAEQYAPYFSELKLATRMHSRVRMIVRAYAKGRYRGNLLDLTEPAFSLDFRGTVLDGALMPPDFFSHVTSCDKNCASCGYCEEVAKQIQVRM